MQSFLWKIYLFRFLDAFKLVGVIFTLLFQHNGLNPLQISLLITIWSITQLVLEVPTGIVADKYPRKNILVLAMIILAFGFCFWLKGGFIAYAIGFTLWGVKNALVSGTQESFVYDELKSLGKESMYEKVNGKMEGAFWAGVTASAVLGGIVATFSFQWTILISILTTILAAFVISTVKSVASSKSTGESSYFKVLRRALTEIKTNTTLLEILILFCLIFATYGAADEYWALIYQSFGVSVSLIGVFVAIGYGLFTLAGYSLHFFSEERMKNFEYLLILISGVLFILVGVGKSLFLVPLIFIAMFLFKVAHIKFDVRFQHAIEGGERATISSLKSLMFEFIYMGFVLLFGFTSTKFGIPSTLYFLGGLLILWITLFKLQIKARGF